MLNCHFQYMPKWHFQHMLKWHFQRIQSIGCKVLADLQSLYPLLILGE